MFPFRAASTQGAPKALQTLPVDAGLPHVGFSKYLDMHVIGSRFEEAYILNLYF